MRFGGEFCWEDISNYQSGMLFGVNIMLRKPIKESLAYKRGFSLFPLLDVVSIGNDFADICVYQFMLPLHSTMDNYHTLSDHSKIKDITYYYLV